MKIFFYLFLLVTAPALALEAVVTVLETPLLKSKSYDAQVVQYLRKGDIIKIHPGIASDTRFNRFAPSPKKLAELRNKMKATPEYKEDPLFSGEAENTFSLDEEFIPALDRQGNRVWVISEHIFVFFGDKREFYQSVIQKDPTDYRLEEPLPEKYPLRVRSGYRGLFVLGFTQPFTESYPYQDQIKRKGYTTPLEFNLALFNRAPGSHQERLFYGGTLTFRTHTNSYAFEDRRFSEETNYKLGVGPTVSYDAFKGEKNRINILGTLTFYLLDRFLISQRLDDTTDKRSYSGYSLAPKLSIQYHRKKIFDDLDLDFVAGTSLEAGISTSYRALSGGKVEGWWQEPGADKFTSRTTFSLGGFLGLQSAY